MRLVCVGLIVSGLGVRKRPCGDQSPMHTNSYVQALGCCKFDEKKRGKRGVFSPSGRGGAGRPRLLPNPAPVSTKLNTEEGMAGRLIAREPFTSPTQPHQPASQPAIGSPDKTKVPPVLLFERTRSLGRARRSRFVSQHPSNTKNN